MPNQIGMGVVSDPEVSRLIDIIEQFNNISSKQTDKIIKLTKILIWLTTVMTVLVAAQLYIAVCK